MTSQEKLEAARDALLKHELSHVRIQREYQASYAKLKILNRAVRDAWAEMADAIESRAASGNQGGK